MTKGTPEKLLYCSFCGKSQHEVKKLIAGPSVFICDECIALCNDIIRDELPEEAAKAGRRTVEIVDRTTVGGMAQHRQRGHHQPRGLDLVASTVAGYRRR